MFITGRDEQEETQKGSTSSGFTPDETGLGDLVNAATSTSTAFTPLLLFHQLITDYKTVQNVYGETLIRLLTGRPAEEVKRNIHIPEYQRMLHEHVKRLETLLRKKKYVRGTTWTRTAFMRAAQVLLQSAMKSAQHSLLITSGETRSLHGEKRDTKPWHGESYKHIDVRKTLTTTIKRGHTTIQPEDIRTAIRAKREKKHVIILLDVSGSMRGWKIIAARKALATLYALAHQLGDTISLIAFADTIRLVKKRAPALESLADLLSLTPHGKTAIHTALREARSLIQPDEPTEIILITDLEETMTRPEDLLTLATTFPPTTRLHTILINPREDMLRLATRIARLTQGSVHSVKHEDLEEGIIRAYHVTGETSLPQA